MNKKVGYTYVKGMNQDVTKSKHPFDVYYDARNIRIKSTTDQSTASVSNDKGTLFIKEIPNITVNTSDNNITYDNKTLPFVNNVDNEILFSTLPSSSSTQQIIGNITTNNSVILFSTDNAGFDCIWELKEVFTNNFELDLLYCRDLKFSTNNPIQALYNYENDKIQKIYWVDGVNQLRFLNIRHSISNGDIENLIDLNSNSLNIVGNYELSQPVLFDLGGGGNHTSGMIQYSYNLYKLNGSQTTISPLSTLISLDKGPTLGGGEVNEIVGTSPTLTIPTLDDNYTHIKVYAIKYTSYNQLPSVSLIIDEQIDSYSNYTFSDSGDNISSISISEFIFLGSNPITPKHIESKDSRLFVSNYTETAYDLNIDARAYSHNASRETKLFSGDISYFNGNVNGANQTFTAGTSIDEYNYSINLDAVNTDYDTYKYQKNGVTLGGEGLYIKYELIQKISSTLNNSLKNIKLLKDDEIYRIGIKFYNKLGQQTDVKWIADFKAPSGNLEGKYNVIKVELKQSEFNTYISSLNLDENNTPVGYKIVRAERNIKDMTILCQGSLTGMMVQTTQDASNYTYWTDETNRRNHSKNEVKLPIPLTRGFSLPATETSLYATSNLKMMNEGRVEGKDEIYRDNDTSYKRQQSWQYTKMMQMHSPDLLFNTGLVFGNGLYLKVKGMLNHKYTNQRYNRINTQSQSVIENDVYYNIKDLIARRKPESFGTFGPVYDGSFDDRTDFLAYNRNYNQFIKGVDTLHNIYGIPEITSRGQGVTPYNGNVAYNYTNSLEGLITDQYKGASRDDLAIEGINSYGERCLTIVLGSDAARESDRPSLESIVPQNIGNINGIILSEVVRPDSYKYLGNIYGGLSIEDKSRTTYVDMGTYHKIDDDAVIIENCGDVFVQLYKFGRILKTDAEIYNPAKMQLTEIVEHPIETTVNLLNRNDISLLGWDNKFQPRYDEYHSYNRVYSQSSNLIKSTTDLFKFKKANTFGTRIISSKLKVPGEFIDSWTDFLENETMDLDGKYGSINSLINSNDNMYALQDNAVSKISINPRVQAQGSDGLSIELGTGGILYDYNYLTTKSGTVNKWSVFNTPSGFYYFDLLNKNYNKVGKGINNITSNGLHSYFQKNIDYTTLVTDNPVTNNGVIGFYNPINKESYLTFLQNDKSFTLGYDDEYNRLTSFYDLLPSMYINKGYKSLVIDSLNKNLYDLGEGAYGNYFGTKYSSYITIIVNPESNLDCVFDNIEFNSELYLNDIDQSDKTLTHIQAWNEYQDSGKIPLIVGRSSNIRRKFRKWRADIPRDGRKRMRNPWLFLKLELDTETNYKMILHDIEISYTI